MKHGISSLASVPEVEEVHAALVKDGWLLIERTALDLEGFSAFFRSLCNVLTFDPARQFASSVAQSVDAGTAAVGLHIENGNTPMPPDVIAFFSMRSATNGSQTTVCDGAAVYRSLPTRLRNRLSQPYSMTRQLSKKIWQTYVATASAIADSSTVTEEQLDEFMRAYPGQSYQMQANGDIQYRLQIPAVREDNFAESPAYANALLGPSYNYEPPEYRAYDGRLLEQALFEELAAICEEHTREIAWQDGDIAVIDNKRCLHGRRAIAVPLCERELVIAMGLRTEAKTIAQDQGVAA